MPRKYNIALLPTSKSEDIVKHSQFFSKISDLYSLNKDSLPHVTLYQFQAEEKEIDSIWERVSTAMTDKSIELECKDFSCVTFDSKTFWVSLMPNEREKLKIMHDKVAAEIKEPPKSTYDPHITLISTKFPAYKEKADELARSYVPISDTFVLAIGECDDIGQFTKLLHQCEPRRSTTLRM